jgi:hypothetical protein
MSRGFLGVATERAGGVVLTVVRDCADIDCEADPRVGEEDALRLLADPGVWDAPHAAQAKSTQATAEADPMRLEVRGRTPTGESLADATPLSMSLCTRMRCCCGDGWLGWMRERWR